MIRKQCIYLLFAAAIRYVMIFSEFGLINDRVEVSTPLNSFKRIKEGVHLFKAGINPYSGDMIHEGPIVLLVHSWFFDNCPKAIPYLYIFLDLLTAVLLYQMAWGWVQEKLQKEKIEKSTFAEDTKDLQMQPVDLETIPKYALLAYLLNPFIIANCASLTTTVFSNFFLSLYFYFLTRKQQSLCLIFLALESTRNLYPVVLIAPAILTFGRTSWLKGASVLARFGAFCLAVCFVNYKLLGSWNYLDGTLGFIFFYRDLRPNIGLFWYFFTEMFEHFRPMFLVTFQMNATVLYLVPLSLKMRKDPVMLGVILVSLTTIFKSYPCFGDVGFYLALLPIWRRCWKFMAHNFVVFCFFIITVLMMPALWHLWIYAGSANANFYFGATLAFSTGQIFLVTDLLLAYVRQEFCLKNGQKFFIDGKEAKLILE